MTPTTDAERRKQALRGLGRLLSISLGFIALAGALLAWRSIHSPDYQEHQAVVAQLNEILAREQLYFRSNQVYTADLNNLGMPYSDVNGWTFRAISAKEGSAPLLLAEASQGERRLALASSGKLYKSFETSLPRIATFKPDVPAPKGRGSLAESDRRSSLSQLGGAGAESVPRDSANPGTGEGAPASASAGQEPTTLQELR